jgi:hypothetical protein
MSKKKLTRRSILQTAGMMAAGSALVPVGWARADTVTALTHPVRALDGVLLTEELVGGFETDEEGWTLGLGPEFPGAQGEFVRDSTDAVSGSFSGLLTGDFENGGVYVQIERAINLDVRELRLWVRADRLTHLLLRMIDSTGQFHQQDLALASSAEWQEIVVTAFDNGERYLFWGGAADGVWHGPARGIALLLEGSRITGGGARAQLRLDDVRVGVPVPDLVIEQTRPGNVFVQGQPVEFGVRTTGDAVVWEAYDFHGTRVDAGRKAGEGELAVRLQVDRSSFYRLHVRAEREGETIANQETTFAVLSPFDWQQVSDSPFAFATHFGHPPTSSSFHPHELIPLIQQSGAKGVRDELLWHLVEPTRGVYEFPARYEDYMGDLAAAGINPFIILAFRNPLYDNNATPYSDDGRSGFANYSAAVLEHYGDQIAWVDVYNEFNIPGFGDLGDGPADARADYYFPLLVATYEKIKATRPNTTVVGAATAGVPLEWLEQLFELGGLDYMDALSIHPYVYPGEPEQMVQSLMDVDALVRRYNGGVPKPIWISEQGWPTHVGSRGVSLETQAAYIVRSHVLALSRGVEKYVWYNFMNKGTSRDYNEDNFGVVHHTSDPLGRWAPKPAYVSYSAMTRELTGLAFHRQEEVGPGISCFVFRGERDGKSVETRVVWSSEDRTVGVRTGQPIVVTDLTGHRETYHPVAGFVYLSVSERPIYVTGRSVVLSSTDKLALMPAGQGRLVPLGEPIRLTLLVDNSARPSGPVAGVFEVAGARVPVHVPAGRRAEIPVTVTDQGSAGIRELVGQLRVGERAVARLSSQVEISHPIAMSVKHVLRDGADVMALTISNRASGDIALGPLEWSVGELSGSTGVASTLPAGESATVDVSLAGLGGPGRYERNVRLTVPGYPDVVETGTIILVAETDPHPVAYQPITIDGTLDTLTDVRPIDLADGQVEMEGYGGVEDLSGQVWLTWDAEHLYLSARVHDDTQAQVNTGAEIWSGDSIQFAVAAGLPGETNLSYEYGVALTPSGPQAYRWLAVDGQPGPVTDVQLQISRDEATNDTIYELALPWSHLTPLEPDDQLFSLSVLVNDNDGQGRKGWIEWGSGIGKEKDPALFRPMVIVGHDPNRSR